MCLSLSAINGHLKARESSDSLISRKTKIWSEVLTIMIKYLK